MWLLESDGDVFHGKRLWIRPGKRFIFGRTLPDVGGFVIENKTISRKHLVIEVSNVEEADGTHLKRRSKVTLEDLKTKIGTLVNGEQIRGQRYTLDGDVHEIKLGHYEHPFRITWHPVILSFSFTSKEFRNKAVESFCQRLAGLDIKVQVDFIRGSTTHVLAKKRNTSKGLQALVNGCYIVDYPFVNAITSAAEQPAEGSAPLELDFDANWPNALDYLPPRGKEPTECPRDAYFPNPQRQDIFDGYTFVFYEQAQFDTLLAPITDGRGKCLLHQVEPGATTVEDFVRYVKSVAGEKGLGEFEDGSEGKGVVVVRYQPAEGPTLSWYSDFGTRVSILLDHRLIEQNEFLDAILNNDASVLRKPLEIEISGTVKIPSSAVTTTSVHESVPASRQLTAISGTLNTDITVIDVAENPASVSATAPTVRRMGRSRRTVTSRFKGFDVDDDDDDEPPIPEPGQAQATSAFISQSQESGMFVTQDSEMDVDRQFPQNTTAQTRSSRKRTSPPLIEDDDDDDEDILDHLAPAAASLKRRRLAEDVARRQGVASTPPPQVIDSKIPTTRNKAMKVKKEPIDILEVARQQREREEEIARAEREALQEAMGDMDIDQIKNLAIIEEMEVKRSTPPLRNSGHADESDRWDERWNGRKNFKKFRRRGETGPKVINKVFVPLIEVKKKDFGIGDDYWLEDSKASQVKRKSKGRARDTEAVTQTEPQDLSARVQTEEVIEVSDVELMESSGPSQNHSTARAQKLSDNTNALQNVSKRAGEPINKNAPTKKPRQATRKVPAVDSDDSDDGLGFRFRKKK